ncbi:hypothetical protein R3I94_015309 [Phoxinus phoxinus]
MHMLSQKVLVMDVKQIECSPVNLDEDKVRLCVEEWTVTVQTVILRTVSGRIQGHDLIRRSQVPERVEVEHSEAEAEARCVKYINMVLLVTRQGPL